MRRLFNWKGAVLLIFDILFAIVGVSCGIASLVYFESRQGYINTNCTVQDTSLSQSPWQSCTQYGCSSGTDYYSHWDVVYYNYDADKYLTGEISQSYDSESQSEAAILTQHVNSTYGCLYKENDFSLVWSLPNSNYLVVGWVSIAFLSLVFLITTILIIDCIECNKEREEEIELPRYSTGGGIRKPHPVNKEEKTGAGY